MSRPAGKYGDTGLEWKGWHRSASESLLHATSDDDPRCVQNFAKEAIDAGREALKVAKNARQRVTTEKLLDAAHAVKSNGEQYSESGVMGDDA